MKRKVWLLCKITYVVLILITFSPLVLSENKVEPPLFMMPKVLWNGILISLGFIVVTLVGALVANSEK
ncbi:hypothetical protein C7377_0872 [Balneicella halophila]|uniref:Uncharacterized protein n=1 Tax=Balneicella halophila TaxID=1537566 RepID=A0A7L4UT91_BALHA|nr:hypothetical protein [Balneicella halophila]PVX52547.1 hypothetical protein C7377_0872 [Balneicella halophila]